MDKFIAHILVVDDDDGIRSLVKKYLDVMSLTKYLDIAPRAPPNPTSKIFIFLYIQL